MTVADLARRRVQGDFSVDEWGLDTELTTALSPLLAVRFSLDVSGGAHLPESGGALLLHNQRFGLSEPLVLGRAVHLERGRTLRPAGVPDIGFAGPALRRLGGVLADPSEIASVLRAGNVASVGLARSAGRAGTIDADYLAVPRVLGLPIIPVALIGSELRRGWRVEIGRPLGDTFASGPLGDVQAAEALAAAVQSLLDAGTSARI